MSIENLYIESTQLTQSEEGTDVHALKMVVACWPVQGFGKFQIPKPAKMLVV